MLNIILLFVGFLMLIKGADVFVESSSGIAKKFNVPSIIIGLTIVAMGTSAPEFSVSVQSAIAGMNDICLANIVGSNIFNLLVVIGLSSCICKLQISDYKDILVMMVSGLVLTVLAINSTLSSLEGIVLIILFVSYMTYLIIKSIKNNDRCDEIIVNNKPIYILVILGILGLSAIILGGNFVVNSASIIAEQLGMSQNLIGLTVIAIGTSLPELVTSLIAAKKGENDIAVGNVVGSNIFNILLIAGTSASINPMKISMFAIYDLLFMLFAFIVFIILTYRNRTVTKNKGIPLVVLYIAYMIFTIIR